MWQVRVETQEKCTQRFAGQPELKGQMELKRTSTGGSVDWINLA